MGGPMPGPGPMPGGPRGPSPEPGRPGPPIQGNVPPYLASKTAARAGRPMEPWKDTLRTMMLVWGAALVVAFMVPVATDPLTFWFNAIIDAEGTAKLEPLLMAAIGLLGIVLALIPTSPSPRGLIAGLLGLIGVVVPMLLVLSKGDFGLGQVMVLLGIVGLLTLVPGLLLRSEYRDAMLPRILVTIGVLCVLLPMVIPQNGSVHLIDMFKAIIDAPGKAKVTAIVHLGVPVIAVLSLLAWLPAPSGGGAKVFAWLIIAWFAIEHFTGLLVGGGIGDAVSGAPFTALLAWVPVTAYVVFTGYGFATVFGKKLE